MHFVYFQTFLEVISNHATLKCVIFSKFITFIVLADTWGVQSRWNSSFFRESLLIVLYL